MDTINKFKDGDIVYAITKPDVELRIKRHIHRTYYCVVNTPPYERELLFFERELKKKPSDSEKDSITDQH